VQAEIRLEAKKIPRKYCQPPDNTSAQEDAEILSDAVLNRLGDAVAVLGTKNSYWPITFISTSVASSNRVPGMWLRKMSTLVGR